MTILTKLLKDESGATAIEYGLIAALLSVAIITVLSTVGDELEDTYDQIGTSLNTANN